MVVKIGILRRIVGGRWIMNCKILLIFKFKEKRHIECALDLDENYKLFYYSAYFYYYLWIPLHFFGTIHWPYCTISTNFYLYL